ncbi:cellulase family glycosylhydrolase [bacterium]|nr:cellulase family glycosylhydrolase [bacterium]
MTIRALCITSAAALLLAACGDDDHPGRTPTGIPTAAFTATAGAPRTATPTATGGGQPQPTPTESQPAGSPTTPAAAYTVTATPTAGRSAALAIGSALAEPAEVIEISVVLTAGGAVAGTQNDIGFPPEAPIVATTAGRPNCSVNPSLGKGGTSFAFQPPGCAAGGDCAAVRAIVLALDNVDPIPIGALLYSCRVAVSQNAADGIYPLPCTNAAASDPDGNALATTCAPGSVVVGSLRTPTPTAPAITPTVVAPTATVTVPPTPTPRTGAEGALPPIGAAGRWFTDALGRVVQLRGVNMVAKRDPFYPAAFGFGGDDAAFLAANGFNAVRLGIDFRGLMPTPGVVETAYLDHLAETVRVLVAHDLFVLLDFHQDGFAPMFNGNGLPDWMAISDGLPNPPDAVFPLYYIQNPAMQRAFESFWANRPGPGGVGIQDYFLQGVRAVAARFADEPRVLGTELMNEPWPGADWGPCALDANGCPDIEAQRLRPFYDRGAGAARAEAPSQMVFVEPFVLFNFGQANTSLPGPDERLALSFHSYALDAASEEGVVARAVAAAERDRRPVLCSEFGASVDPVLLNRIAGQLEQGLVPWLFWSYDENITIDLTRPPGGDNLRSSEAFDALVRPYPVAVAGTPTAISFDPATRVFRFEYDTTAPAGGALPPWVLTAVSVPARQYPGGYLVEVEGAVVTSPPDAPLLTLQRTPGAAAVTVAIAPAV